MADMNFPQDDFQFPKFPDISRWIFPAIVGILVIGAMSSSFYTVEPDSVGVVQRFGKYVRTTQPGLRMKIPFGVETVKKVRVLHVFKEEFGFRTVKAGVRTIYAGRREPGDYDMEDRMGFPPGSFLSESMMLTGDLNIAVVEFIIQFRIADPLKFVFNVRDMNVTIRNMAEAAIRLVVGDRTINEVLTLGREEIRTEAKKELQALLDRLDTGIQVTNLVLQDVNPPDEVKPSFNEVNEAKQEMEKAVNQAWENYNRIIPKAKGEASKTIRQAEGYAVERVNNAKGEAQNFQLNWEAYQLAKDVTRRRLYLEAMRAVLPGIKNKFIVDEKEQGILPLLSLNKNRVKQPEVAS
ncbi:MAG: FtsH protease activity modulator HflK [Candidatus Omnitrophica bacterium]|nr:FtsH protease activity modulator HflK [Candidatus Omnitrophota bacterium]